MRNFVFDIYGTLIDIRTDERSEKFVKFFDDYFRRKFKTDTSFDKRYNELCAEYAVEQEPDFIKIMKRIAAEGGSKPTEAVLMKAARVYRKKSTQRISAYDGIKNLLDGLKKKGKKLYILSNAQSSFTVAELKKTGLYEFFDGIELSSDFGYKKPSLKFFDHIIKKYGLDKNETVYIGNDIRCDAVPAKAARLTAAYIRTDISPSEDTVESAAKIADFATDNHMSLSGYLLNL